MMLQHGQAVWDASAVKALAAHIQATLIPPVEQLLLVDYPLRTPPAADAVAPTTGFKLDEVSISLKVTLAMASLLNVLSHLHFAACFSSECGMCSSNSHCWCLHQLRLVLLTLTMLSNPHCTLHEHLGWVETHVMMLLAVRHTCL